MAQNSSAPRSQEDYITQVSEEIEGRVTKSLSKEFSRTENCILGALARLDDFLMNPLLPGGSGTTPEPTRNASGINQGTNEDDSQNDPHPEASLFHGQREQNSGTERDYDSKEKSHPFTLRFIYPDSKRYTLIFLSGQTVAIFYFFLWLCSSRQIVSHLFDGFSLDNQYMQISTRPIFSAIQDNTGVAWLN